MEFGFSIYLFPLQPSKAPKCSGELVGGFSGAKGDIAAVEDEQLPKPDFLRMNESDFCSKEQVEIQPVT